jgi:hypothetical protein
VSANGDQCPNRGAIEKRAGCRDEPVGDYMHTEHIDVGPDFSDAQIAETFLHHRVLIVRSSTRAGCGALSPAPTSSTASASASSSVNKRSPFRQLKSRRLRGEALTPWTTIEAITQTATVQKIVASSAGSSTPAPTTTTA